jgi:Skp family chaperone for outer membrane proteins
MMRERAAALCSLALAVLAASTASGAELKIGVVDVEEIVARYKKAEDLKKAEEENLTEQHLDLARRTRLLDERIAAFEANPKAADRAQTAREIQLDKYILELDVREFGRSKLLAENRIRRRLADEIVAVCNRIGKREGYDLILKQSSPARARQSDRERVEAFELNPVLYADDSINLTSRVLEVLENAYSRGTKLVPDEPTIEDAADPAEDED